MDESAELREIATSATEVTKLEGLVDGKTYMLRETEAPAGYELLPNLTFTVDEHGDVTLGEDAPSGYSVERGNDGVVTIVASDAPVEVKLVKQDLSGNSLDGASFSLTGLFVNDTTHQLDSQGGRSLVATVPKGGLSLTGLQGDGTTFSLAAGQAYTLTEQKAPAGHRAIIGTFSFTVNADGTVTADAGSASSDGTTPGFAVGSDNASIVAYDDPFVIDLVKRDASGKALPGAELTVTPVAGGSFADGDTGAKTFTTGNDGTAKVSGLVVAGGSYTVTETKAPAGYELNAGELTFTVAEDGFITAEGTPTGGLSVGGDRASVIVADELIELDLAKVNTRGSALSGATFKITGVFSDSAGANVSRSYTVGTDGKLRLEKLVGGESYEIVETVAPSGYRVLSDPFEFEVRADGTISASLTSQAQQDGSFTPGYFVSSNGLTLVAVDERRPSVPSDPSGPDDPVDPDEPVDPDDPTDPDDPDGPDDPADPDDPDTPVRPANPVRPQTPDTGDHTDLNLTKGTGYSVRRTHEATARRRWMPAGRRSSRPHNAHNEKLHRAGRGGHSMPKFPAQIRFLDPAL